MKRIALIVICLLALWLCVCSASAETPADAARTLTWTGTALTSEDQTAAFWEYPRLQPGQTRRDGGLTLINQSSGTMQVDLTDLQLPYDDDAALAYLGALRLTVRDGDRVLYDGAFLKLNDDGLTAPVTVGGGESRRLSIDLACDFGYEGEVTCGEQVIYWNWTASSAWFQPVLDTWMYWAPALLLIVGLTVLLRRRRRPASTQETKPAASETEPAISETEPELPPDLPKPAPRKPVTIQISEPARRQPPKRRPESGRHAATVRRTAAERRAMPRRHKAEHAAPRHAKKK